MKTTLARAVSASMMIGFLMSGAAQAADTALKPPDTAAPKSAAPGETVGSIYRDGSSAYALGHFREALSKFERAYKLKPLPALLFNIAQCHRQLKEFDEAATTYRSFIRLDPKNPQLDKAQELLEQVEEVLRVQSKAQKAPPLDDSGRDPGRQWPRTPPIPSDVPSDVALSPPPSNAVAPAPKPSGSAMPSTGNSNGVRTDAGGPRAATPQPAPSQPVSAQLAASQPAASQSPASPSTVPAVALAPAPKSSPPPRTAFYAYFVAGAGVAALAAGGVFGLMSKSTANDLTNSQHSRAQVTDLQSKLSSQAGTADALFAVGGGLLLAGGALFIFRF